uniref:Uncharacterized protein n=1 Tax=Siphoviridae sp. ctg8V11 TaxID=2827910 RepID=A0A8S5T3Z2_9CAUD|nr:MAG TPA: hypothetical protein [Siphoviridae sp. ctg8V11]
MLHAHHAVALVRNARAKRLLRQWLRIKSPLSVVTQGTHEIVARFPAAVNIFN